MFCSGTVIARFTVLMLIVAMGGVAHARNHLTAALAVPVVVDNRSGAPGVLGYQLAARAPADGYTMIVAPSSITTVHLVTKEPRFDVLRDCAPISQVITTPQIVVVNASIAARNIQDLVALSKKGALTFGTPGQASAPHLAFELLKSVSGMSATHDVRTSAR
ncbi:MAG TPA: tripartite tricarboxylate transporter substrate-binding protein [Burkholderiales bacterium]|nr:tripartite tricarboxylate transporter substrate-binding protein [Burkholderiales bacterium]